MPKSNKEKDTNSESTPINFEKDPKTSERVWWLVLIKYAVSYGVAVGIFFIALALRNYFSTPLDELTNIRYIADAFTFPAAVFILFSLLVLIARAGTFNGLLYALRHVGRMFLPFLIRSDITYEEFLMNREQKKSGSSLLCFFIVGGTFLVCAIVFIILFETKSA